MSYASNVEEINGTRRKINISVAANSVQDALNSIAKEMQTTAEVRGFRKGKAPLTLIRKFYMNDIVKKAADKIINDAYSSTIKTVDFQIVSHPQIEPENQFTENNEFKFSATVDINPKLEMKDYKNLTIKLPENLKINVNDQYEKMITSYQKAFGKTETIETERPVEKNDFVKISYKVFSEGQELEKQKAENQVISLDNTSFPEIEAALLGMKINESKVVNLKVPENYKDAELRGKLIDFHLTLNSIEKSITPELDDEFAKRLGYENMETAKTKIFETLENMQQEAKVNAAFDQIVEQVLEKNNFDVAESLIESTIDRAIQEANINKDKSQHINPENVEQRNQFRDIANKNVRGILALGHIARQEEITVSDEELYRDLSNYAISNQINPRDLFKGGNQVIDEFRGQAMIRKVINKLLDHAHIEYIPQEEKKVAME